MGPPDVSGDGGPPGGVHAHGLPGHAASAAVCDAGRHARPGARQSETADRGGGAEGVGGAQAAVARAQTAAGMDQLPMLGVGDGVRNSIDAPSPGVHLRPQRRCPLLPPPIGPGGRCQRRSGSISITVGWPLWSLR
ncbi:MAG: hypothetical protein RLZZ117_2311 [Cyanobacteriota bacterium]